MQNASFAWKSFDQTGMEIIYENIDNESNNEYEKTNSDRKRFYELRGITLTIYDKEFIVVTGLIGSGKKIFPKRPIRFH